MTNLANSTIIVTGGSRCYGAGIAEACEGGAQVWITGRDATNLTGALLSCRPAAMIMQKQGSGQILVQTAPLPAHLVTEEIKLRPMVQPMTQL